jgi:N-formylglutamate amidohydrolase
MRPIALNAAVAALLLIAASSVAAETHPLVFVQRGTLPILLTSPHGGPQGVPGVSERKNGKKSSDRGTLELVEAVAAGIAKATGGEPYVVGALFHRKYIDANRGEDEALESPQAQPAYRAYHAQIRAFVTEIRQKFPQGALLLDIHGQNTEPDTLVRGTQNRKTVAQLLKTHGEPALSGPESILGALEAKGYRVFPPGAAALSVRENPRYAGGFTVQTYGSHTADGIDAIQLEFGPDMRRRSKLAEDVAAAIVGFGRRYLGVGKG